MENLFGNPFLPKKDAKETPKTEVQEFSTKSSLWYCIILYFSVRLPALSILHFNGRNDWQQNKTMERTKFPNQTQTGEKLIKFGNLYFSIQWSCLYFLKYVVIYCPRWLVEMTTDHNFFELKHLFPYCKKYCPDLFLWC